MLVLFQSLEGTLKSGLTLLLNNQSGSPGGVLAYAAVTELSFGAAMRLASVLPEAFSVDRISAGDEAGKKRLGDALTEAKSELKEGLKLAGEAEQRRNQLVHSHWFVSPGYVPAPGKMTRMKTRAKTGSVTTSFESASVEDLDANSDKAQAAQKLISSALDDYQQILRYPW